MIRKFIAWANKRWPEQLQITVQDYTELREEVAQLNRYAQAIIELDNRLKVIERDLRRLNEAQGFVSTSKGAITLER